MDKWTVARTLDEIAKYLELSESNPFKARAFDRAARKIESLDGDIETLLESGELYATPGIGKATGQIVAEVVATGGSRYLEELRAQYPTGIFDLMRIPGFGLKKIGQVYSELGIGNIEELEKAAREGKLAKLKGFGAKTQDKILEGIDKARSRTSRFLLPKALAAAEAIRERLADIAGIDEAEIAGSVRRRLEVVQNVNIVVAARDPEKAVAAIRKKQVADKIDSVDDTTIKGLGREDIEVFFHVVKPEDFGAAMLRATGSAGFVEAFGKKIKAAGFALNGFALEKNGRHIVTRTEHDLFEKSGIPFVEPERREDGDDLARKKRVKLIQPNDLRGTFHVHTTFSDGRNTVKEMLAASRERGFEYVGLSDHSKAAFYARGLTEQDLERQHAEIDATEGEVAPMRVFRGSEVDILQDGTMDYDAKTRAQFDFVIASIHSRFGMSKEEMTERILRALDDPTVTFLGHLTGRKLLSRDGYTMNFDRVFDRLAQRGVILEINGNPWRLDVDWRLIGKALDRGVVLSIHPDAHSTSELRHTISGTWVARKAGLSAREIFNARPVEEVAEWLALRRKKAQKTIGAA